MPHYISLMRWTSQGMAGLPAWRERVEEGERIIQEAGGRLIGVYVTLGRYDVVEIFEAKQREGVLELRFDANSVVGFLFALGDGIALQMLSDPERDHSEVITASTAAARHLLTTE